MQSYMKVVDERYNEREKNLNIYNNIYSLINPIGFYGTETIRLKFFKIFNAIRNLGVDLSQKKILDIGCGYGGWTRFFAELTGKIDSIYGVDLSTNRIEKARSFNPNIKYRVGDMINMIFDGQTFDIITAIDALSHLNTEEQINSSLKNIHNLLNEDGFFIWYDISSKNHFESAEDAETYGYSKRQMIDFATENGFKAIMSLNVFKKLFWKYHSLYLAEKKIPFKLLSLFEKILPGSPGNLVILFQKI
jgi:ubiquinone/menaquinone biosynthesis C-methylase UbiE